MNFFDHQDAAHRATRRLVILFVLAVFGTIVLLYLPVAFVMAADAERNARTSRPGTLPTWLDPAALALVTGGAVGLITLGALVRRIQLSGGGRSVAESLGGRWLDPASASPSERRLLDLVEEMSIASGVPVPPVAVLEDPSVNAFAAGTSPTNAVLGFTRGAIDRLSREELQGVVAHEFSHIAHGDMLLNIRLACAIAGIMVIALIGRVLLHVAARAPRTRSKKGDATVALLIVGLALLIAGSIGAFFGRILQAAVSRQREFLADASAAQYTRNPRALASALRTIAGLSDNSLDSEAASGLNHFFFTSAANAWLASHPPIEERIRRLEGAADRIEAPRQPLSPAPLTAGMAGIAQATPTSNLRPARGMVPPPSVVRNVRPLLARRVPKRVLDACHEPFDAQAVLLLTAWAESDPACEVQREAVRAHLGPAMLATVSRLRPGVEQVHDVHRMTLLDLCMPALQQLSQRQYVDFHAALVKVIRADGRISLYEWVMRSALARRVEARFSPTRPHRTGASLESRRDDAFQVLSTLAWASDRSRATLAYRKAVAWLPWLPDSPLEPAHCSLDLLGRSADRLAHVTEDGRHRLIEAAAAVVAEDGMLHPKEVLLLRGIADRIDVLIPTSIEMLECEAPGAALDA